MCHIVHIMNSYIQLSHHINVLYNYHTILLKYIIVSVSYCTLQSSHYSIPLSPDASTKIYLSVIYQTYGMVTVSYTHLDVYKRQDESSLVPLKIGAIRKTQLKGQCNSYTKEEIRSHQIFSPNQVTGNSSHRFPKVLLSKDSACLKERRLTVDNQVGFRWGCGT